VSTGAERFKEPPVVGIRKKTRIKQLMVPGISQL
jgi:hypothetical protein